MSKKGWWGRNWKWFVPMGCLGILICIGAFVTAGLWVGYSLITSSTPYQSAVSAAQSDPRVKAVLGFPVTQGLLFTGNINKRSDWSAGKGSTTSGWADFYIPIYGPKGKGKIHVVGTETNGIWVYKTLIIEIEATKEIIDLNQKPKKSENLRIHEALPIIAAWSRASSLNR